jgi:uncharacterized protein
MFVRGIVYDTSNIFIFNFLSNKYMILKNEKYLLPQSDIKLFNVDNKEYLYYVPRGLIYEVNDSYFRHYLDLCLSKNTKNSIFSIKLIKEIYSYFINSVRKENTKYLVVKTEEMNLSGIVLNISGSCNLNCSYCFARKGKTFAFKNMSTDVAIEAIDYLVNASPNKTDFSINFFGGEPFLKIKTIDETIQLIENKYPTKKFHYSATTNGTILTEKHIELVKKHNISLLISIDGTEEVTNRNRPFLNGEKNTFRAIIDNSLILKSHNISFEFRATVVAGQDNILDIIIFFESQKVGYYIVFCFSAYKNHHEYSEWNEPNINILTKQFNEAIDYYFEKIKNKEFIYATFILEKMRTIALREVANVSCGAGRNMIAVNADKSLYTCMNYSSIKKTSIGSLSQGIDFEINKNYMPEKIDETLCKNCNIRYLCAGACMAERYFCNENIIELIDQTCKLQEITWTGYLKLFQRIKNLYPKLIDEIANHKLSYENIC